MLLGEGDYRPSAELLELFNTLPAEFSSSNGEGSSTAGKDIVVKSEVLDTVLRYGTLCLSNSLLFFDCRLTALQDGDSSNDSKAIVVKSEVVETKITHGMLRYSIQVIFDNHYTYFIKMKSIVLLVTFLLLLRVFQTFQDVMNNPSKLSNKNHKVIMAHSLPKRRFF